MYVVVSWFSLIAVSLSVFRCVIEQGPVVINCHRPCVFTSDFYTQLLSCNIASASFQHMLENKNVPLDSWSSLVNLRTLFCRNNVNLSCDCGIASLLVVKILWLSEQGRSRFKIRLCCLVSLWPYICYTNHSGYLNWAYFLNSKM